MCIITFYYTLLEFLISLLFYRRWTTQVTWEFGVVAQIGPFSNTTAQMEHKRGKKKNHFFICTIFGSFWPLCTDGTKIRYFLGISWTFYGHFMDIFFTFLTFFWDFWIFFGNFLDIFWTFFGHFMDFLDIFWHFFLTFFDIFWTFLDILW